MVFFLLIYLPDRNEVCPGSTTICCAYLQCVPYMGGSDTDWEAQNARTSRDCRRLQVVRSELFFLRYAALALSTKWHILCICILIRKK